jgi:glycosyltransferase involved in cell wall biosynthesis
MTPKISVVMSVYNGEKHLRESIDSILNQTFTDFEFIIINDGSTDHTKQILESYSDPRIRLFHQKNIGLTKSLNRGLNVANGEYIARQDADDISLPNRLEIQLQSMRSNRSLVLVGSFVHVINSHGRKLHLIKYPTHSDQIRDSLLERSCFCHGSVIFDKGLVNRLGGYCEEFKYAQDYDLWLRVSEHAEVSNIASPLYKLRFDSDSITFNKRMEQHVCSEVIKKIAKKRRNLANGNIDLTELETISDKGFKTFWNNRKFFGDISKGYLWWGNMLFQGGDFKSAKKLLTKALVYCPLNSKYWVLFLRCCYHQLKSRYDRERVKK